MARKADPKIYREVCKAMDAIFVRHGDPALTCVNRYLRIRTETRATEKRIARLEAELKDLRKVDSIDRQKRA